jgi:hypothetical protein
MMASSSTSKSVGFFIPGSDIPFSVASGLNIIVSGFQQLNLYFNLSTKLFEIYK